MQLTDAKASPSAHVPAMDVLVESVYQSIKESILGNQLRPGNKLTHQGLAERLGVSRTPVRESLERLYQEGYVTRIPNRGFFVAEIDAQEVRQLYQTREALEVYGLQRVLQSGMPAAAMKRLKAINAQYRVLCLQNLSRDRLLVDREFHVTLAEQSGNKHLSRTLAGIFERLILKRRVEGFHDLRGIEPYQDHVRILAAIEGRDEKEALRLLRAHIDGACTRFLQYMDGAHSASSPKTIAVR